MIIGCIDHQSIELFLRNLIKYVAVQNRNIVLNTSMQGNKKVDILSVKNYTLFQYLKHEMSMICSHKKHSIFEI